jgi:hypothetical protein
MPSAESEECSGKVVSTDQERIKLTIEKYSSKLHLLMAKKVQFLVLQ